jgi:hypothetical protein
MPYDLPLPKSLKKQRWKVKIWDREIGEDPHVSIVYKTTWWRWAIRDKTFMDASPDPSDIPQEVLDAISENYRQLCLAWNRIHPSDPVEVPPDPNDEAEDAEESDEKEDDE